MDFEDKMHRQQFEEMYNQYQTPLRKLAYRYNVPVDDIEDMVHDTFLSYARSDYSLELPPDEMRKLLSRILKNRCIDFHRSAKRRNCYSIDDDGYYREEIFVNEKEEPLIDGIISKEKCRALMNELENLPMNWREVAKLKLIEGRPTDEVCRLLNISEKACYSRVSRIRKYLQKLVKDENWPSTLLRRQFQIISESLRSFQSARLRCPPHCSACFVPWLRYRQNAPCTAR